MTIENSLERIAIALEGIFKNKDPQAKPVLEENQNKEAEEKAAIARFNKPGPGRPPKKKETDTQTPEAKTVSTNIFDEDMQPETELLPNQPRTALKGPVTIELVRAAVAKHVNKHGTESLKKIMRDFGAAKIVDIAVMDYAEIVKKLEA